MENKIFGNNLKDVMRMRGITQKQLAEELCCSERCVQNYCYGRQPKEATIIRICKILNVCREDMMFQENLVDTIRIGHKLGTELEKTEMSYHSLENLIREIVRDELKEILKSINYQL